MIYEKGKFVVVPIEGLEMLHPTGQALFMWICKFSDEDGICFPSRKKLAGLLSCDMRTVDKHMKFLVDLGFLSKTKRKKSNSKENMSNLYQIQIVRHPSEVFVATPSEINVPVTIPNLNSTILTNNSESKDEEKSNESITQSSSALTLPVQRGKTPASRLLTIYKDCFKFTYGFDYKTNYSRDLKILKEINTTYSELQVARMLTIFFTWHGMSGNDVREYNYYTSSTFPLTFFKSSIPKYEAYIRNVLNENFDDDVEMFNSVGGYINSIKK